MGFGLNGAVTLVTGAAGGIGAAVAEVLSEAGARVVGVDVTQAPGCIRCDVSDDEEVRGLVERVVSEEGGVDVLVHAAGITRDRVLWKLSNRDWKEVLDVNLGSAFLLLRAAAPYLRRSDRGAAVLIASINAQRGKFGQSNYAASKAGLIGLAKSAAREMGRDGVRINVVAPGMIATPMATDLPPEVQAKAVAETTLGHMGQPQDVAHAVLFLSSSLAGHITGQVLRVDGGQLMA